MKSFYIDTTISEKYIQKEEKFKTNIFGKIKSTTEVEQYFIKAKFPATSEPVIFNIKLTKKEYEQVEVGLRIAIHIKMAYKTVGYMFASPKLEPLIINGKSSYIL